MCKTFIFAALTKHPVLRYASIFALVRIRIMIDNHKKAQKNRFQLMLLNAQGQMKEKKVSLY